jgi:putative salt-induced outer membrane protein YdiY
MCEHNNHKAMNLKTYLTSIVCFLAICTVNPAKAADTTNRWETTVAVGLTVTRGNSETLMANANVATAKKWSMNELMFGADGTYGESEFRRADGTTDTQLTAQNFRAFGQYNRLFNERLFAYARVEGLHDNVADIDYRFTFSPGLGYYFIKNTRTFLRAELGPGYIVQRQGGETSDYITLRVAERFEHKLNDRAKVWQALEFLPQVDNWDNFIINFEVGIDTAITTNFSLRTYLQNTYDNEPAPGREENDMKLVAGIAYKF